MIITCNKCSTHFNLDDFLVKADGSKVRCSVCQHIFTVYPLPRESEQAPEELSALNLESDPDISNTFYDPSEFEMDDNDISSEEFDFDMESDDLEMDDTDFEPEVSDLEIDDTDVEPEVPDLEIDDTDFEPEVPDLEIDDTLSLEASDFEMDDESSQDFKLEENPLTLEDDDIDFQDDLAQDFDGLEFNPIEEEPVSSGSEDREPTLKMENEKDELYEPGFDEDEDEFELEFEVEDEDVSPETLDRATEHTSLKIEPDIGQEDFVTPLEELETEDVFSEYDNVLEQETEPEDDLFEQETIEIDDTQEEKIALIEKPAPLPDPLLNLPKKHRRKKKKSRVGAPALILLLIFFLVIGAYIASLMTGYKIPYLSGIKLPFIEQYFNKPSPETLAAKPVPNQKSVNGRFVTNSTAGTLFVITGRVDNPSNINFNHIEVRGALITTGKIEAKIKNAFCGNIITEEMLKTGNMSDINTLLATRQGNNNSNINVTPGTSIPFMVVFSDLPEKLQNFTVKVSSFEKSNNNG